MSYSIKDLAEILGCSTSAIRYFEKENLITVEKEKNGYRYYNVVDIFRMLSYTKYRSMGFPMKSIIAQFSGKENNRSVILERVEFYKAEALRKAQKYADLANAIENHLGSIRKIDSLLNQYELAQSPELIVMCDEECGWISKNRTSQHIVHEWVEAMPDVQLAVLHRNMGLSDFGYLIETEKQRKLGLPLGLKVELLPQTSCLHTVVEADKDFAENPQHVFYKAFEYVQSKGLHPGKMAWGKILLVEVEEKPILHPYVELWISIKI